MGPYDVFFADSASENVHAATCIEVSDDKNTVQTCYPTSTYVVSYIKVSSDYNCDRDDEVLEGGCHLVAGYDATNLSESFVCDWENQNAIIAAHANLFAKTYIRHFLDSIKCD